MQRNIGKLDKVGRVILGLVLVGAGLYFKSWWGAIGVVPIATAIIGWCPAYLPFGINTMKRKKESAAQ